jgi:hypothetical protein
LLQAAIKKKGRKKQTAKGDQIKKIKGLKQSVASLKKSLKQPPKNPKQTAAKQRKKGAFARIAGNKIKK